MPVVVDTTVWSLVLRRTGRPSTPETRLRHLVRELIRDGEAMLLGCVRQELLSGVREQAEFDRLRVHLRMFDDVSVETADYERAAQCSNACRRVGIQGSSVDWLICAIAIGRGWSVLSTDHDFVRYSGILPLRLYASES